MNNPATDQLPPPPPPPAQPHRPSFSCDKHPQEKFTGGFCPSCLCERLSSLDQSSSNATASSSSRRPSAAGAGTFKPIFQHPQINSSNNLFKIKPSLFSELRRSKSFSASKNELFSGVLEPQRKSCDVRGGGQNSLSTLLSIGDDNKLSSSTTGVGKEKCNENIEEEEEEVEEAEEVEEEEEEEEEAGSDNEKPIINSGDEIRLVEEEEANGVNSHEMGVQDCAFDDLKTMKDHIDLDLQVKKPALSNFWAAASVFSKKWHKWRRKQKLKKPGNEPTGREFRDRQLEIADYGFRRRSCDADPRFSLDAGRVSFDDQRYSFERPRASWDGHLIGRTFMRLPPMVEEAPVERSDSLIPVEQPDENVPGGSAQTREYYMDSSSRRKKSVDRSNSIRKTAAAVMAEIEAMNGNVSPATIDYLRAAKILDGERGQLIRDCKSKSLRDNDCSKTFELAIKENGSVIADGGSGSGSGGGEEERKGLKKSWKWTWKLWGFIHRRGGGGNKDEEEEKCGSGNGVERSFSESWQDMREDKGEGKKNGLNRSMLRSNSSVSRRGSFSVGGGLKKKKKRDDLVLARNGSDRRSIDNHVDNGLLKFYVTPLPGSRSWGLGFGKRKMANKSHSFATKTMMQLY